MYDIQHCFVCRPSDSTASEDAGVAPRTVVITILSVRSHPPSVRSHASSVRSHAPLARSHPHSARSRPHLAQRRFIHEETEMGGGGVYLRGLLGDEPPIAP
jgi:hypothetical protein